MQASIQQVWEENRDTAFLISSRGMLMLLAQGAHTEKEDPWSLQAPALSDDRGEN